MGTSHGGQPARGGGGGVTQLGRLADYTYTLNPKP